MTKVKYDIEKVNEDGPIKATPLLCSARLGLALIGFFMFFHLYAQRIGMSVAIVCMVNHTAVLDMSDDDVVVGNVTSSVVASQCLGNSPSENGTSKLKDGPFAWPKDIQGHILGAFFYGYLVSQVPGGLLAERYGGKWVLVGSLGLSTLATMLTPVAARGSYILLIFLRVLCGIGSGALYPAMHAMLGQWAPPMERSKLCGITYAGSMMGNVIALPVSGVLCQYGFDEGWASVFYVFGITTTVCIIIWMLTTSNTPATHPRISKGERDYIIRSLRAEGTTDVKTNLCQMPWLKFMTSGPVWALIVANFCTDWGLYTYLTNIPTFYREVLNFDIQSNGIYSALPFLGLWAIMNISPMIADKLRASGTMSTIHVRKLFNTIGLIGPAAFLIGLSFIDCTQTVLAVVILVLAVTVSGFVFSGYFVNHMDIAPRYAGTLMGIANGLSASAGFIAPYVASVVTKPQTRESWQIVFFIAAGVYTFGAIMYCILASGEIQPWANDSSEMTADEVDVKSSNSNIYRPKNGNIALEPMLSAQEQESDSKLKDSAEPMLSESRRPNSAEAV